MNTQKTIKIALVQLACGGIYRIMSKNILNTSARRRPGGARIIGLQELFNAQYFPQTVDVGNYRFAARIPSNLTDTFSSLAAEWEVVLIVPVYEEAMAGVYFNTALVFDTDGCYLGKYRKNHIPDGPQYHEKFYFTPGDMGYPVFDTKYGGLRLVFAGMNGSRR
jgi:N-carbamoylputrescine amidase